MAAYRLPDHLGVCEIDRRTVMLDLRRDRYFQLDSRTASAFRSCREAPDGSAAGDSAVPELVKRGWLVPLDGAPAPVRTIPDVRRRSLIGELPHRWNHLVDYDPFDPAAGIVHFTSGGPYFEETKDCDYAQDWLAEKQLMLHVAQREKARAAS